MQYMTKRIDEGKTLLPDASWLLGENEVTDATETGVIPPLSVQLPTLGVEPRLEASSEAAFGVPAGSERSAYDVHSSELRTSFGENRSEWAGGWRSQQRWAMRGERAWRARGEGAG